VIEAGEFVRIEKAAVLAAFADVEFARAYGRDAARQIQVHRQLLEIVGIRSATVSVEKGRVDNGPGNGGEHPGHHTPSHHGEDGPYDEDPNQDFLGFGTRCIPEVLRTVTDG
jgi:hypothetical protein